MTATVAGRKVAPEIAAAQLGNSGAEEDKTERRNADEVGELRVRELNTVGQ